MSDNETCRPSSKCCLNKRQHRVHGHVKITLLVFLEINVLSIPTEDRLEDRTLQDEAVTLADLEESPAYQESQGSHLQSMGYRDSQESQPQPKRSKTPVMELSAELSKLQESLRESDGKSL